MTQRHFNKRNASFSSLIARIFVFALLLLSFQSSYATHLIGGNLAYEYIGKFGANYRFKLILTTYTNCDASSNIPDPENPIENIGIYEHDLQNNPTGGGNKNFITDVSMALIDSSLITPDNPGNCSVGGSSCIKKGVYEGIVDLPLNFNGYHAYYERCCRNNSIVNLIPQESMAFHAYISPPLLGNSSPQFTDDPVPFLCVGDTTTILNSAYDADGDLLVFSFVTPYNGYSSASNPAPSAPTPSLGWNIPNVTYAGGFNVTNPLGSTGYTSINASTGLTTYFPPSVGDYVVAVEIKEYRGGNLIGYTRRDLQLLVLNCPTNPGPNIDPNLGATNTQFTVEEGSTLCFDFGYNDPNGDSVTITSAGAIFDPLITNPAATITSPVTDLDTVSTEFCWTTACGQAQTLPYNFQVTAKDNGCPPKSTNEVFEITVTPVPPPNIINGLQVACQFGTQTYNTTNIPNTTYNWNVTGGTIVADNGSSIDVNWTAIGAANVSVSATNQFGCISEPIDMDVTIAPAPTVDAGPNTTICFGDTAILAGTTTANTGYTISWDPAVNTINNTTLTPSVFPTDTTQYILTIDIGGGCFGIDSTTVNVIIPAVDAGIDTTICEGDSVQLNGTASLGTSVWSPTTNLSDPNILNPFASPVSNIDYILELTDGNGCVITDTMSVTVSPSFVLTTSNDTTICDGDCAILSASGATNYAWSPSATLNDTTLFNPTACPNISTTYTVIGSTGTCSDTATIAVTVGVTPNVDAGLDASICENDTIQLTASGATLYTWTPNTNMSDPTIATPDVNPSTTTEYFVTGSDALGCTATDSVTITVNNLPNADAGDDKSICSSGASTEVLDGAGVGAILWTPALGLNDPTILNPVINPTVDTQYIIEITDANGCVNTDTTFVQVFGTVPTEAGAAQAICPGDTITLGGSPSSPGASTVYSWSPAGLVDDATLPNPEAFPLTTTMFYLSTSNDTCNGIDSVLITVNALPNISAGSDVSICINDSTSLTATGGVNYTWNTQATLTDSTIANPIAFPQVTTDYIVTSIGALGCVNSDTVTVNINVLPTVDAGSDVSTCINSATNLLATGATTYQWSPTNSLNNAMIANPYAAPAVTTTYYVIGTDGNNCENIDSVNVTVNALPLVDAGADASICLTNSYQLNVASTAGSFYSWTPTVGLSSFSIANPLASPTVNTTYVILVTDANGCQDTDTIDISILADPVASFDTSIIAGCEGAIVKFNNTSSNDGVSFFWSFGDGETSNSENTEHVFPYSGSFTTYMVTTNASGCTDTASITGITQAYADYFTLRIPNVFTPNGDGDNDLFGIDLTGRIYECVDMRIYNRWGQLMFVNTGPSTKWDGHTSVGIEAPVGTYFYTLEIKDDKYSGTLELYR